MATEVAGSNLEGIKAQALQMMQAAIEMAG